MNTIFDYLKWRGDLTFEQSPFNEVDAGVLARFAYEPMEGVVSSDFYDGVRLGEVAHRLLNKPDLDEHIIDKKLDPEFLKAICDTNRFKDVVLSGYINDTDFETQVQFSAVCCDLDGNGNYLLAFRGTDNTLIGWKEDFNMGYEFPVPSQERSVIYLEECLRKYKDGTFMIAGHSKGGNLSIYSSTFCKPAYRRAITKIYNFDGPGFITSLKDVEGYNEIFDRIITVVPAFSIVGMVLEHEEDYTVVESGEVGIMQHEILSWGVLPLTFDPVEDRDKVSMIFDRTVKDWLGKLDKNEREVFVENLYNVINSSDMRLVEEFNENRIEKIVGMIKSYKDMDNEAKKGLKVAFKQLFESTKKTLMK